MTKVLYMLIGLPGSGKSSFRKEISADAAVISTDDVLENLAKFEGKTYNEVFKENIAYAERVMAEAININKDKDIVIWDQTNLTSATRKSKLAKFPDHKKIAVYFDIDHAVIDRRNEEREKFGRSIPWGILSSMKKSIEMPTEEEGFDAIVIRKNS